VNFLDTKRTFDDLDSIGVKRREEGEHLQFDLDADDGAAIVIAPEGVDIDGPEGAERVAVPKDVLATLADDILHALHANEVVAVPRTSWGDVLDVAAFALASNESWLDVDAEASLHLNTCDPLTVGPADRSALEVMLSALVEHGGEVGQSLYMLSLGGPFVLELRNGEALIALCESQAVADRVRDIAQTKS
jgi:hypothetical protein